ncbi:putative protein [Arabidopsis thaliana]|nr:putative protein [Arabidopsis thaliana]
MTKNNVVEVSTFLFFEASADSETTHQERGHDGDDVKGCDDCGEDAESCRCEMSTSQRMSRSTDFDTVEEVADVAGENEGHVDEDGEVNSYRKWPERRDGENLTVDSSSTGNDERLMSEIEKNRMFWEACLAS